MITYEAFGRIARKCEFLDHIFGSDWFSCTHKDHPFAIQSCTIECCPAHKKGELK